MKNTIKRLLALLLMGMVLLTAGCSDTDAAGEAENGKVEEKNGSQKDNAMGRYVERQLATPENFDGRGYLSQKEDGSLVITDLKNAAISVSKDYGASWETEENDIMKEIVLSEDGELTAAAVAPDGSMFFSYVAWNESTEEKLFPEKYIYVDSEGTRSDFELGIADYCTSVSKAVFSADGSLFLAMNNFCVYELDLKTQCAKKIMEAEGTGSFDLFSCGSTIAVTDGTKAYFYDMEAASMEESDTVLNDFVATEGNYPGVVVLGAKEDEKIYAASRSGIYTHIRGGSVMEQLSDGCLCNLGDPSKTPANLLVLEDDTILILYTDGELDSYTYDPTAATVPEQQLTIYSLYENDTVRQAVSIFRKENPDVYVKMEIGVNGSDGVTENDAIRNLNTELLAGNGPDLLILDGMPITSYFEKGMLLDLSETMDELEQTDQYYENILKAYQEENGIYAVPIRFALPVLTGETDVISEVTDLKSLADAVEEQADSSTTLETVYGTYTAEETIEQLYMLCEGAWYQEDKSVNRDAVTDFFTQMKRIYEADQKNLEEEKIAAHEDAVIWRYGYVADRIYDHVTTSGEIQQYNILCGQQKISGGLYQGMSDLQTLFSVKKYLGDYALKELNGQAEHVFIPNGIVGICSNTKEPELAASFLKTLLGKEVQGKDLGDGFPVNRDAFAEFGVNPNPDYYMVFGMDTVDGGSVTVGLSWPTEAELKEIEALILKLEQPANLDAAIYKEVLSMGKKILTGEKTFEDGLEEICEKLTLRNAE